MNNEAEYYSLTKRAFGLLAPFYDLVTSVLSFGLISGMRSRVVDLAAPFNGSKILDVATGTGDQALAFAKKGFDVMGVDITEAMLKIANKKNKFGNAKFQPADATALPFQNGSFDVSTISFALHDMPLAIREKVLREMTRVTRPGGSVMIVDYSLPGNKIGAFLAYRFVFLYERSYYSEFIRSDLRALINRSGIEIIDERPALFGVARIYKGRKK